MQKMCQHAETRRNLHTHTHTHTHTGKFCLAFFSTIFIFMAQCFASGIPATNGVADPATCDTDTLETSTGPVQLRAQFTPEVINLKWYNGNTRITVPTTSNTCTYETAISLPTNPTKTGYKFKGWKIIPGTRIEYLQSTGTQWIDTGVKFTGNVIKYNLVYNAPVMLRDASLFGASDSNTHWAGIPWYWNDGKQGVYIGSSEVSLETEPAGTTYDYSLTIDRNNNTWEQSKNNSV